MDPLLSNGTEEVLELTLVRCPYFLYFMELAILGGIGVSLKGGSMVYIYTTGE